MARGRGTSAPSLWPPRACDVIKDPRRALLEHEHEVAVELAQRYLGFCEESWFSD